MQPEADSWTHPAAAPHVRRPPTFQVETQHVRQCGHNGLLLPAVTGGLVSPSVLRHPSPLLRFDLHQERLTEATHTRSAQQVFVERSQRRGRSIERIERRRPVRGYPVVGRYMRKLGRDKGLRRKELVDSLGDHQRSARRPWNRLDERRGVGCKYAPTLGRPEIRRK